MSFFIGTFFIRETRGIRIWDEVGGEPAEAAAAGAVSGASPAPAV
jgi:hypothetical protein